MMKRSSSPECNSHDDYPGYTCTMPTHSWGGWSSGGSRGSSSYYDNNNNGNNNGNNNDNNNNNYYDNNNNYESNNRDRRAAKIAFVPGATSSTCKCGTANCACSPSGWASFGGEGGFGVDGGLF